MFYTVQFNTKQRDIPIHDLSICNKICSESKPNILHETNRILYNDEHGVTNFIRCLQSLDHNNIISFLKNNNCELETILCDGNSAIFISYDLFIENRLSHDILMKIIDKIDDINIVDSDGNTILHRLVLQYGTIINNTNKDFQTIENNVFNWQDPDDDVSSTSSSLWEPVCYDIFGNDEMYCDMNGDANYVISGAPPCASFQVYDGISKARRNKKLENDGSRDINNLVTIIKKVLEKSNVDMSLVNDSDYDIYMCVNNVNDRKLIEILLTCPTFNPTKMLEDLVSNFEKSNIIKCSIIDLILKQSVDINSSVKKAALLGDTFILRKLLSKKFSINKDSALQVDMNSRCYKLIESYIYSESDTLVTSMI